MSTAARDELVNALARRCAVAGRAKKTRIWACVDLQYAPTLIRDIEINRDVATHRVGLPNPDAPAGANAERHLEWVSEFYLEHSDPHERVPLRFGEELALIRLLGYCRLMVERPPPNGISCLI